MLLENFFFWLRICLLYFFYRESIKCYLQCSSWSILCSCLSIFTNQPIWLHLTSHEGWNERESRWGKSPWYCIYFPFIPNSAVDPTGLLFLFSSSSGRDTLFWLKSMVWETIVEFKTIAGAIPWPPHLLQFLHLYLFVGAPIWKFSLQLRGWGWGLTSASA